MSVAHLRLALLGDHAGKTMFPPRTPFFEWGELPCSAQAGSLAGKAAEARSANLGPAGPLPVHRPGAGR
jgi:hypothetical protein